MNLRGTFLAVALAATALPAIAGNVLVPQVDDTKDKVSVPVAKSVTVVVPSAGASKISVVQPKDCGTPEAKSNFVPGHAYENPIAINGGTAKSAAAPASKPAAKPAASTTTASKPATSAAPATKPATTTSSSKPATTSPAPAAKPATSSYAEKPATSTAPATKPAASADVQPAAMAQIASERYAKAMKEREERSKALYKSSVEYSCVDSRGEFLPNHKSAKDYDRAVYTNIHFRDGETTVDPTYLSNASSLETFNAYIKSVGIEKIASILIVSKDSPEGLSKDNVERAEKRALAVQEYIRRQFPPLITVTSISPDGESWELLRAYIAHDRELSKENGMRAIETLSPFENIYRRKESLEDGGLGIDPKVGDISAYVRKKYFPLIRNAAIYIELKQ